MCGVLLTFSIVTSPLTRGLPKPSSAAPAIHGRSASTRRPVDDRAARVHTPPFCAWREASLRSCGRLGIQRALHADDVRSGSWHAGRLRPAKAGAHRTPRPARRLAPHASRPDDPERLAAVLPDITRRNDTSCSRRNCSLVPRGAKSQRRRSRARGSLRHDFPSCSRPEPRPSRVESTLSTPTRSWHDGDLRPAPSSSPSTRSLSAEDPSSLPGSERL